VPAAALRVAAEDSDYGCLSEVVRDRGPAPQERDVEELRRLVREGIESGQGLDAGAVFRPNLDSR
jgi:hypothetical protein